MDIFSSSSFVRSPDDASATAAAAAFLCSIGIACHEVAGVKGFLKGVAVEAGCLLYDPACPVSNLLHEAGHIGTAPLPWRQLMTGDVSRAHRVMFADLERLDLDPDCPLMRAALQCSDPEATAWAWAAGKHLGLPEELIILDSEYDGDGAGIRLALSMGRYAGIHGLAHAGFCSVRAGGSPLPTYPSLAHWTQPARPPTRCDAEAEPACALELPCA